MKNHCKANPCCGDPYACEVPLPQHRSGLWFHNSKEYRRKADQENTQSPQPKTMDEIHREQLDRPRLKPASPQTNVAPQCCMCGKKNLSTVEGDGGTECELEDGRWVCSSVCWDRAVEPSPSQHVAVTEAAKRYLAAIDSSPENDIWDTWDGKPADGALKTASDASWADHGQKIEALLSELRAALATTEGQEG